MELVIACMLTVYGAYCDTPPPIPVAPAYVQAEVACGPYGCDVGVDRGPRYPYDRRYQGDGYGQRRYYGEDRYPDRGYGYPARRGCYYAGGVRICP